MPDQLSSVSQTQKQQIHSDLGAMLESNLGLPEKHLNANPETRILGAIPEFDSMSVVNLLIGIEEAYGIVIDDDELDAAIFETLGSLSNFVQSKLG